MLPDVEPEKWRAEFSGGQQTFHGRVILIGGAGNFEFAILNDEPSPAGAEAFCRSLAEGLFASIEGAKCGVDRGGQGCRWFTGLGSRSERFPKEIMIPVTTALVTQGVAQRLVADGGKASEQGFEWLGRECGSRGEGRVQIVDISGVVLVVMDFHGSGVQIRLKGVESIRQRRQLVGGSHFSVEPCWEQGGGGGEGAQFDEVSTVEGQGI